MPPKDYKKKVKASSEPSNQEIGVQLVTNWFDPKEHKEFSEWVRKNENFLDKKEKNG